MVRIYFKEHEGEQFDIIKRGEIIDRAVTVDDLTGRFPGAIPVPSQVNNGMIARDYALWEAYCGRTMPMTREQFDEGNPADRVTNMVFQGGVDVNVFRDNPRKLGLSEKQAEWVRDVHYETKMHLHHALELHEELADLTAKHFALHLMAHNYDEPFTKGQGVAWDQIERELSEVVSGINGISGMVFRRWDISAPSAIKFDSGLTNVAPSLGSYKMHLNDDVVPNLLKQPFWVEYETRGRNAAITETIKTLRATRDEWARTAARSDNKLIGERNIVIDVHGRAFTQYTENNMPMVKLELPNASLTGVSHMDAANAEKAKAFLEASVAEAAPFRIWDFQTFAKTEIATNDRLIEQLEQRLSTAAEVHGVTEVRRYNDEPSGP
jgi:hypothetical protein